MVRLLRKAVRYILIFVSTLFIFNLLHNLYLLYTVDRIAHQEISKIQLPNELKAEQLVTRHGCSYDYKVGKKRCNVDYVKYFTTSGDPAEEFVKVDAYLKNLGWPNKEDYSNNQGSLQKSFNEGYSLSEVYYLRNTYGLTLYLNFLGSKEKDYTYSSKKTVDLMSKYSTGSQTLYSISISTDVID